MRENLLLQEIKVHHSKRLVRPARMQEVAIRRWNLNPHGPGHFRLAEQSMPIARGSLAELGALEGVAILRAAVRKTKRFKHRRMNEPANCGLRYHASASSERNGYGNHNRRNGGRATALRLPPRHRISKRLAAGGKRSGERRNRLRWQQARTK